MSEAPETPEMYAAVRVKTIRSIKSLRTIEAHGRREDESSKRRADLALTENNIAWSCVDDDPLAVVEAFRKRKADTGATEYKNAPLGLHIMCIVSPAWVAGAGDMHDPNNPRNKALFDAAKDWGDKTFGTGSVVAARLDVDEKGGGVVDLVIVPVSSYKQRGKEKTQISVNKAYERAFGGGRVYGKMQDSWSKHAQEHLDPTLKRGKSKEETQREHVHADIIRPALELANQAKKEAEAWRSHAANAEETANSWLNSYEKRKAKSEEQKAVIEKQKAVIEKQQAVIEEQKATIQKQKAVIEKHEAEIAGFRKGWAGKFAEAREADLKEKVEEIRASESAKNDELLQRAQFAEANVDRARNDASEARKLLARQEEKYSLITEEVGRRFPGAAREIRDLERDFENYKAEYGGGGSPVQEAGVQHDDDEATRNLKIAAARESAVNVRNASGPSM